MGNLINFDTVYVWDDKECDFIEMHYTRVVCDECGAKYSDEDFWWDGDMLVCGDCGQQFYQTKED